LPHLAILHLPLHLAGCGKTEFIHKTLLESYRTILMSQ
jgi:hypothetical protein